MLAKHLRLGNLVKRFRGVRQVPAARRGPRLSLHPLEDRTVPASFSASGTILTADLGANQAATILSAGTSYSLTLAGGTWSGVDSANVTGNGLSVLTVTAAGLAAFNAVNVTDSGTGAAVAFGSGANVYSDDFNVTLDAAPAGSITFGGTTNFGNSNLTASTSRNIVVPSGVVVTADNGSISLSANQQAGATSGNFIGIDVNAGTIQVTGAGTLSLSGRGGDSTAAGQLGVEVRAAGSIQGGASGTATVNGTGGAGGSSATTGDYGVLVTGAASKITSAGGAVHVIGHGGGTTFGGNFGVRIDSAGTVTSGGTGTVTVEGTGGAGGNFGTNYGVYVVDTNSQITSLGGAVTVIGTGGGAGTSSSNLGIALSAGVTVQAGGMGAVTLQGSGGGGSGSSNGVDLLNPDAGEPLAVITSTGGDISIMGMSSINPGTAISYGVRILGYWNVYAGGMGNVTIVGSGPGSSSGSDRGVHIQGRTALLPATITSSGGSVSITGTSNNSGTGTDNYGVSIQYGSVGAGGTGTVTVTGTGGATSGGNNDGVLLFNGQINSSGGDVSVTGTGGGTGGSGGAGSDNKGVYVWTSSHILAGGTGSITVVGHGAASSGGNDNVGVLVSVSSSIASNGGDVSVTGTGGGIGTSASNYGVAAESTSQFTAGGAGNLTVLGTGGGGTGSFNYGVEAGSSCTLSASGGDVSITGTGGGTGASVSNIGVVVSGACTVTAGGTATVTVSGTGGATSGGTNYGVWLAGVSSQITSSGGDVSVTGTGGSSGTGTRNYGVYVNSGGQIGAGGTGDITVIGQGSNSSGNSNVGVYVLTNAKIASTGGDVSVTGTGRGTGTSALSYGVAAEANGQITAGGAGTLTIVGAGGPGTGNTVNHGVLVTGASSTLAAANGDVTITGTEGGGTSAIGVAVQNNSSVSAGGVGNVTMIGDTIDFAASVTAGANTATLRQRTNGRAIGVGGADVLGATLGLTDAELDRVTAGTLRIGDANSGTITITNAQTRPASTNVVLTSGGNIIFANSPSGSLNTGGGSFTLTPGAAGSVQPISSAVDATTSAASALSFGAGADLAIVIPSAAANNGGNNGYHQLSVAGLVDLTGVDLVLSGGFTPSVGNTFTIVINDLADPVIGTFNGLPEGATIPFNTQSFKISYVGGTGNDVVLTAQAANQPPGTPTDNNSAANSVAEGAANGSTVGVTANALDPNGDTVTYSLTDNAGGRFAINSSTGVVTVANGALLNYEDATSHSITVQASDGAGGTSTQSFTIAVTNVNPSTPTDSDGTTNSVAEGAANGSAVGVTASSSDPNGPAVAYSLTDSAGGRFAIDASTGVVTVANGAMLNYEDATSHSITVQASAGAGGTSTQSFTIAVTNVNPTVPTDSDAAVNSVAEGSANGSAVGVTASSSDPNGPAVTYSLTDSAGGRFAINSSTGVVTVANGALLNYEDATSHSITVQASDGAGGTSTQSFTIAVTNVNPSTPTDSDAAANSVAEGAANGSAVGVTTSSSDPNGPAVTYSLTDNAGGRFAIDASTGVVTVADATLLNYEDATSHSITVQASDGAGGTSTQSFSIAVTNVNPSTPTDSDGTANSVAEGAANGSTVGVTASSSDPNGPAVTYSLTDSAGGRFAIDASTGVVTVANGALLNYEDATSHSITVQASDGAGGTSTQSFTIAVTNVNPSTPTDSDGTANSVAEGAANGSTVGVTASSSDPNGPAVTYSLTDSAGGRFAINSSSGVVTVANGALLNYEDATSHSITVQASDGAGGTSTQAFTVAVSNVNPSTPTDSDGTENSVAEGAANGSAVGVTASSSDPNGPAVTYSLTDSAGGRFAIDASTGVVTVANGALLDGPASHTITVQTSDGAGGTSIANFTIAVSNVAPTAAIAGPVSGDANTAYNFTLTATDPSSADQAGTFTYRIDWEGDGVVDQTVTGPSGTVVSHSFADEDSFDITVTATDRDGAEGPAAVHTIDIGDNDCNGTSGTAVVDSNGDLIVTGTSANDQIRVQKGCAANTVKVRLNHHNLGTFTLAPTARIHVCGLDGNDKIRVGNRLTNAAIVHGGNGNDQIWGGGGNDQLFGDDGCDKLWARCGADMLDGGTGNDELHGGAGDDSLLGGDGNDELWGGCGGDTLDGGAGNDTLHGGAGGDILIGGTGDDTLRAGSGGDTLLGGSGDDTLKGGAGDDWMDGGDGDDRLDGQAGNDILLGGTGDDLLIGGDGRDILIGGDGADRISGNADEDILIAGYTAYDSNATALLAIQTEWISCGSYASRTANIVAGTGSTMGFRLVGDDGASQTVFNDNQVDVLAGGQGTDWFFANRVPDNGGALDVISDLHANELWNDTDF